MFCLQARERKGRSILLPFYLSSLQFNGAAFKKCKQPFFICDLTRNENNNKCPMCLRNADETPFDRS